MGFWSQVRLLMWKNFLKQRRRICVSIFEVLLPVCYSAFITFVRSNIEPFQVLNVTYYDIETIVPHPELFPTQPIIGYTPASKATDGVMKHVLLLMMRNMPPSSNLSVKGFTTEEESVKYYQVYSMIMQHIIVFHGVSSTSNQMPTKLSFSIRTYLPDDYWLTGYTYPLFIEGRPRYQTQEYRNRAVLYLQSVVAEALARYWIEKRGGDPDSIGFEIYSNAFPFPPFYYDTLAILLRPVLPLLIVLSFMLSVVIFTKNVVTEKEKKLKKVHFLSGGNKRKLSTAIALIGDPPFIVLDEPSSGMDPQARRNLWTVLSMIRQTGRTIVLTSHSVEECDAVCTRIAIMVNGKFVCLGSPQHLKSKFAQGYTLVTKLGTTEDGSFNPSKPIIDVITSTFEGSGVFDDHEGYIHFQVPQAKVKVAEIFALMEDVKHKYGLEDYSVHQTTLDQVFLSFTKKQIIAPECTEAKGLISWLCSRCRGI